MSLRHVRRADSCARLFSFKQLFACVVLSQAFAQVGGAQVAPKGAGLPTTAPRPRSATDTMSYVYLNGPDTVAIERTVRRPDGVRGELVVKGQPRIVWQQHTGARNTGGALDLDVYAPTASAGAAPLQSNTLRVVGDSGFLDVRDNGVTNTLQRIALPVGAEWTLNNSVLHTDLLTSLARARGVSVLTVVLAQGGAQVALTITSAGDTTIATGAGNTTQFVHDALGLKEALIGGGALRVHRATVAETKILNTKIYAEKPSYSAPANAPYTAQDVIVTTPGGHQLAGTLTKPKGVLRPPVVVTITGNGEQDRDSKFAGIPEYALFRDIADTLGRRGIAVLRVDDRGVGASTGRETRAVATTADYANDVRAVVNYLFTRKDVDTTRIALLGHSEGGIIAPMVAEDNPRVHAIVLLAGTAYTGRRVLLAQNREGVVNAPSLSQTQRDSIIASLPARLDSIGLANPWIGYFMQHDPAATAREVKQPVLILQGAKDQQVTPEQADTLAAAFAAGGNKSVTKRIFPNTDHLFLADSVGAPTGYASLPSKRISPAVLGAIADWLAVHLKP